MLLPLWRIFILLYEPSRRFFHPSDQAKAPRGALLLYNVEHLVYVLERYSKAT